MLSPERRKFTFHDGSIYRFAVDRLLNNLTACDQRGEHFGNIVTGRIVDLLVKCRKSVFPSNRQLDIPPQQTARIMIIRLVVGMGSPSYTAFFIGRISLTALSLHKSEPQP